MSQYYKKMWEAARLNNNFRVHDQSSNLLEDIMEAMNNDSLKREERFNKVLEYEKKAFSNTPDLFFKALNESQPFVFIGQFNARKIQKSAPDELLKQDLACFDAPFQSFTFELMGDQDLFDYSEHGMKEGLEHLEFKQPMVLFHETKPRVFNGYALNYLTGLKPKIVQLTNYQVNQIMPTILNCINKTCSMAQIHDKTKIKVRENKQTIKKEIGRIIYLKPKQVKNQISLPNGTKLDFSHRFLVRGHWRTIGENRIGKNRAGEYEIVGSTWVREFEKGGTDKELIKKERIILNEQSN